MAFVKAERTNPDFTEASFAEFASRGGELIEYDLIPVLIANHEFNPMPICESELTPELREKAYELGPWGYSFDIAPGFNSKSIDRERFGAHPENIGWYELLIRTAMLDHAMKHFAPSGSWLDLATNSGSIPLILAKGRNYRIDASDFNSENIEKANYLKEIGGISNCNFTVADAYEQLKSLDDNAYDIISAHGIFYHLSDPLGLAQLMFQKTKKIVMIETIVQNFPFSGWFQTVSRHVKYAELAHANDTRKIFELHPTYRGMIDTLFQSGFSNVFEVLPSDAILAKYPGTIFSSRNRRLFIGIKS